MKHFTEDELDLLDRLMQRAAQRAEPKEEVLLVIKDVAPNREALILISSPDRTQLAHTAITHTSAQVLDEEGKDVTPLRN